MTFTETGSNSSKREKRAALHHIIEALLWILLVVFVVYLVARIIDHAFTGITTENKRIDTLRSVVKFGVQAVGGLVILFIIIGMPTQTTTVLGLAGAGLTVAMKDFIVAFFGWFILMGAMESAWATGSKSMASLVKWWKLDC